VPPAKTQALPKELLLYVDGKDPKKMRVSLKAYKCKENKCMDPLKDAEIEKTVRKWTNQVHWAAKNPNKTVPKCDGSESLIVEAGWNMVYDIAGDSCPGGKPYLNLIVHGRLTLQRADPAKTQNINLRVKHIFVTGELIIGTKDKPIPSTDKFKITLYGEYAARTVVYDGNIEAGNKVLASIGKVDLFGSGPAAPVQKLLAVAPANQDYIMIAKGLTDWKVGDKIYMGPTGHKYKESDYSEIKAYDSATGKLTLKAKLKYYHWGAAATTATKYKAEYGQAMDIRQEVIYLSRSVVIEGDTTTPDVDWGGHITISDTVEASGKLRAATLTMDNVEMYHVGQK